MNKRNIMRLLEILKPCKGAFVGAIVSALIGITLTLFGPVLIGQAVDTVVDAGKVDFPKLIPILALFAGTLAVSSVFQWMMALFTNRIVYQSTQALRIRAFHKLNTVPLRYIDGNAHGDIVTKIVNDITQIGDGLLQGLTQLFSGVITILGTLIFMLLVNPLITLVVVLLTPLSIFIASFIVKHTNIHFTRQSSEQGEIGALVSEMVGNQKIIKAFGYEGTAEDRFDEINTRLHKSGVKAQFFSSITNPCTRFVNGLVYAAVGISGAIGAVNGLLSVGQIASFLNYANQYTKPFNEISGVMTQIQTAFASTERVFSLLEAEEEYLDQVGAQDKKTCLGDVAMQNVSFSYRPDVPLIQNLNLSAAHGSRIAIVGPTGCGKTTLVNLLMRFYELNSGSIEIDGQNIQTIKVNDMRRLYGMVLQDTWLSSASIRDNIAYGRPDATDEEVVAAAKAARAHSFIMRLPNGYHTLLSENAANLSQGQKQLLSIARVLLVDPPMLILDEATSNIDTRTEIYVQQAFEKMMKGRTSFIVAHRLSTIKEADLILVMEKGHIVEQGTHAELLEKHGFYAQLYYSQFAPA